MPSYYCHAIILAYVDPLYFTSRGPKWPPGYLPPASVHLSAYLLSPSIAAKVSSNSNFAKHFYNDKSVCFSVVFCGECTSSLDNTTKTSHTALEENILVTARRYRLG